MPPIEKQLAAMTCVVNNGLWGWLRDPRSTSFNSRVMTGCGKEYGTFYGHGSPNWTSTHEDSNVNAGFKKGLKTVYQLNAAIIGEK